MKRTTDPRSRAEGLPDFLANPGADAQANGDARAAADDDRIEQDYDPDGEHGDDVDYEADDGQDEPADFDGYDDEHDDGPHAAAGRARNRGRSYRIAVTPPGGTAAMACGALLSVGGIVAAFAPALGMAIARTGVEPQLLTVLGVALVAVGMFQRRVGRLQQLVERLETRREQAHDELRDTLAELLEAQTGVARQPGTGDEQDQHWQQALLSLQRQDHKVNNLTKAIKMYGKPLMEIAGQGTEIAGCVAQVRALVEKGNTATHDGLKRLGERIDANRPELDLGDVPAQLELLEEAMTALGKRLQEQDTRDCLQRIEQATTALGEDLASLPRDGNVQQFADGLQQRLDAATSGLQSGIAQLRDGNLCELDASVREIQRELKGLATGIAKLQAAVQDGVRVTADTPRGTAAESSPPKAAPAPAAAAATAATATAARGEAAGSTDGYATGKHKTTGKNVLGAIARLKQMKG